jgi:hypothetical protein
MIIGEALFVGLYCAILSRVVNNPFMFGVTKHVLSYVAGVHSWFCREREAGKHSSATWGKLGSEAIFEGLAVVGLCAFLGRRAISFFIIGILLHLGSEFSGFNRDLLNRCHL